MFQKTFISLRQCHEQHVVLTGHNDLESVFAYPRLENGQFSIKH